MYLLSVNVAKQTPATNLQTLTNVVDVPTMNKDSETHVSSHTGGHYKLPRFTALQQQQQQQKQQQQHITRHCPNGYLHKSQSTESINLANDSNSLPHFKYKHQTGTDRNLPRQPELLRILSDPDMRAGRADPRDTTHPGFDTLMNSSLDVHMYLTQEEDSESSEHLSKRKPFKRPRDMCTYCRKFQGDHKSWCIYFEMAQTQKVPKRNVDIPRVRRRKCKKSSSTERGFPYGYSDTNEPPDFSNLHRDVYIRALTNTRVHRLLGNRENRVRQTSKPFVFSYFGKLPKLRKPTADFARVDGMRHIFGKENIHSRFESYYKELTLDLIAHSKRLK